VRAVTVVDSETGRELSIGPDHVLDATELGELLPMCGVEHVTGCESRIETGEPHAPATAQPANMQAISHCFAVDHVAGQDHTIEEPPDYAFWRDYRPSFWPAKLLSLTAPDPQTLEPVVRRFVPNEPEQDPPDGHTEVPAGWDLWTFRRILSRPLFGQGFARSD